MGAMWGAPEVIVKDNLNGDQFLRELDAFSQLEDHKSADMCVVVVASHGNDDHIISTDNQPIRTEHIVAKFNNQMCPNLRGKPKFFIFQACRALHQMQRSLILLQTKTTLRRDNLPMRYMCCQEYVNASPVLAMQVN
eukprot:snap_masked-scaffold874_size86240-processed-gene-0.5 protein:Tk04006 transcript:snap_masked-scaffold874_size86240-processed-gene-0.5-mRNA-1 annotation:"PREDICTED: caspase-2-like"